MKEQDEKKKQKLETWQKRLVAAESAYESRLAEMDRRERAYRGEVEFDELVENEATKASDIKQKNRNVMEDHSPLHIHLHHMA